MTQDQVFDEGAQLERTALAWQRTLLSLAVASLAVGRGLERSIGPASWVIAVVGLLVAGALFVQTRRRYLLVHRHLTALDARSIPGGAVLIGFAAALAAIVGISALAFVISAAL